MGRRRPLNVFDAAVILVSAMPALGVDASLLRLARLARLVHFARHIGYLRLLRFFRAGGLTNVDGTVSGGSGRVCRTFRPFESTAATQGVP